MCDETSAADNKEMTSPLTVDCSSELAEIKLDLCDDSSDEGELQPECLTEDNLKKECVEAEALEVSVNDAQMEIKSSPPSKSRYGRVHKPKIDEDFLSTDKKVGAILGIGILCTPQKSSGASSKTSTPRKLLHSPNGSFSDVTTTDLDTSAETLSRSYRDVCNIVFTHMTEDFKGFGSNDNGCILSSLSDVPVCAWKPGDLAWARVGSHPYWPCIVTVDPSLQTFKKISLRGQKNHVLIHVQFYGDKGRRSWLSSSSMREYEGLDAFNKLCEEMVVKFRSKHRKLRDPFIIRQSSKGKWDIAVSESEAVNPLTREMRLLEFISKYQKVADEVACLIPEPDRNFQAKRKSGSSSEPHVAKKVRISHEVKGSRAMLVKKKLSLSDDSASPGKKKKVPLSHEDVNVPAVSPPEKNKVQSKLEQFFTFTRRTLQSINPYPSDGEEAFLPSESLLSEELPESKVAPGIELTQEVERSPKDKVLPEEEVVPKCEIDDVPSQHDVSYEVGLKDNTMQNIDVTPKNRKSLRLSLSAQDKISVKSEVSPSDEVPGTAGAPPEVSCAQDTAAVANVSQKHNRSLDDSVSRKDESGDEWLPNKRKGSQRYRDGAPTSEQAKCASAPDKGKHLSEEEEAFYQFNLVHTQIVMDDNPYWSKDKVDSYVRMLWNNLDGEDKTKFGRRTDAEKKKYDGGKAEKPTKRLYTRKKKEVDVSDDDTASSVSSEDQECLKDDKEDSTRRFTFQERKPASLFRGMKNEKVCHVCDTPRDTVKCKGPCLGIYHLACLSEPGPTVSTPIHDSKAELVVSSDSGVEESDSDTGDARAIGSQSACNTTTASFGAGTGLAIEKPVAAQEAPVADRDGDRVKKTSIKKKQKKSDKDEESEEDKASSNYICPKCVQGVPPPCFACNKDVSESGEEKKQRCVVVQCGKFYHPDCLKLWPQAWFNCSSRSSRQDESNLTCPQHTCHTCASDDPRNFNTRFANERLVRCIRCPTAYHFGNYCVPAGSIVLNMTQIICSRHCKPQRKGSHHVNAAWCFICAMGRSSSGGSLICCDLCPTSFHAECLNISPPEGGYICEDCGTGRFPLYGEIVWAKLGNYRWWPAQIVFPDQVPENIENLQHSDGEFVVRFFGSHDYNWVNRSRVFLYQEGDSAYKKSGKTSVDTVFLRAVNEAQEAHKELNLAKASREAEPRQALKPPQYVKIKCNKPVGNVRVMECDSSNLVPCYCDPKKANPCGPDTDCLNRILMVECSPAVCRARDKCRNQRFEKREYPPLLPYKTEGRGWGLKTLADIKKGDFVIEYVGEMIDEAEYKRRLERKHLEKDENYYFLTIDKDRMLDAGPKGNVSRFMNHSCQPNCETQKWTVNGDTRVGLFALDDIPANTEVTFNYNLQCASTEKKQCMCGAPNCSGFIGSKASKVVDEEKKRADAKGKKKQRNSNIPKPGGECFQCCQNGDLIACDNKTCPKKYHLKCVNLSKPSKGKWTCPWHQCNVCKKHRTSKRCSLCPNSYCAQHEEGNIYSTAKETYCTEHTQGSVMDGSSRSTSRMSTEGSGVQQPISSDLGGRSGEAASGDRGSRASCSKYRTSAEQMVARETVGMRRGVDSVDRTSPPPRGESSAQVIITEVLLGAVRRSVRKSQFLYKELPRKGAKAGGTRADSGSVGDCGRLSPSGPDVTLSSSKFTEEASVLTDVWLEFPTDDEASGSSVKDNSFCEFQESRRKDLLEMRRAQHKRIGQKVTEMCQAKSLDIDLKNLVGS